MGDYNPDIKAAMDTLVGEVPGVVSGQAFGYPCYRVRGKVFAFVCGDGVALKLPKGRAQTLIAAEQAQPFDPGDGVRWKDWALLRRSADDYGREQPLLDESIQYVAEA